MFTHVNQNITTSSVKDNIALNAIQISLEANIAAVGIVFMYARLPIENNTIIFDTCVHVMSFTSVDA